jgi:anti-sigma regulatory factor (Ser/Thr protein kinase)
MAHVGERDPFRHEALFYAGVDDFVVQVASFVQAGAEAGEPTLVMVEQPKFDRLREALDHRAPVAFADMAAVGANPARIIPAWCDFVSGHGGRPLRGVGEPLHARRRGPERAECHVHESLVNRALAGASMWLLCPYDVGGLDALDVQIAVENHPLVWEEGEHRANASFVARRWYAPDLPEAPGVEAAAFEARTLARVRRLVDGHARAFGLDAPRRADFVLALSEIATNSVVHGGGGGSVRCWEEAGRLVCEVEDGGWITEPMVGRVRPGGAQPGGYGLWLANQLADLVQVRSSERGTVVRLHVSR